MTDDINQPDPVLACATCGYLVPSPEQRGQPPQGVCRANPPQILLVTSYGKPTVADPDRPSISQQAVAMWPTVAASEWCGAHTALVEDPPETQPAVAPFEQH